MRPAWFCVTLSLSLGAAPTSTLTVRGSSPSPQQSRTGESPGARAPLSRNHPWWGRPPWGISVPGTSLDGSGSGSPLLGVIGSWTTPTRCRDAEPWGTPPLAPTPEVRELSPTGGFQRRHGQAPRIAGEQKPRYPSRLGNLLFNEHIRK